LVRHAQAEDAADDRQRHLTRKGRKDARALGKSLRPHKLRLKRIWHSGLPRAVETAEEIAPFLRGPAKLVRQPGLLPGDSPANLARKLAKANDDLMIVGHEPFLGRLAAQLVVSRPTASIVRLRKPSIACLERDDDDDAWRLSWMLPVRA
jgi:phosphohistidine phosphatase